MPRTVHRALVNERGIMHRDMSLYNILMYPQHRAMAEQAVIKDRPPLIEDVLAGHKGYVYSVYLNHCFPDIHYHV